MAEKIGCGNETVLSKIGQGNEMRQKKLKKLNKKVVDGWKEPKAYLRIAYSNK